MKGTLGKQSRVSNEAEKTRPKTEQTRKLGLPYPTAGQKREKENNF